MAGFAARPDPTKPSETLAELIDREREIARLVAEGLTNEEIAGRLVISPLTAARGARTRPRAARR